MPRAPKSLRPWTTSSGIFAWRSICCGWTRSVRKTRRRSRNAWPFSTAAGSSSGCGWMRSRRKLPRKSSLPNDGLVQTDSRLASATCFDCWYDGFDAMNENHPFHFFRQRTSTPEGRMAGEAERDGADITAIYGEFVADDERTQQVTRDATSALHRGRHRLMLSRWRPRADSPDSGHGKRLRGADDDVCVCIESPLGHRCDVPGLPSQVSQDIVHSWTCAW